MGEMITNFEIKDAFWAKYEHLVLDTVIPYQEKALLDEIPDAEKSHAVENFRQAAQVIKTGKCDGTFYGMVFQDSDVAKWLEAVAYSLMLQKDEALEKRADEMIALVCSAQHEDGYLNTYFTVKEPEKRWTNLQEAHELYCAGHMIEAAVAYYEATGKTELLDCMTRMADHIYDRFCVQKTEGYSGHPEIELALMRLYHVTMQDKYLELAKHFINVRGVDPDYFAKEAKKKGWQVWGMNPEDREYAQNQAPVRELTEATGHAVRAVYLYTGMADLAAETKDASLVEACHRVWKNIVNRRMYLTGGIGSAAQGEAFTKDYDLPNDTAYAETCASIGLIFFARKMWNLEKKREYADVAERALYNTVLAGMQLDGKKFFYVNPLEVLPGISGEAVTHKHALPQRPKWFGCACCPPNIARLLTSIADYAWEESKDTVYSHLYMGGTLELPDKKVSIEVNTEYPYKNEVSYVILPKGGRARLRLAIRIPAWSRETKVLLNGDNIFTLTPDSKECFLGGNVEVREMDGYLYIKKDFVRGDEIKLILDMEPVKIFASSRIAEDSNKVAFMRGPLVYCVEGVDNQNDVLGLRVDKEGEAVMEAYSGKLLSGVAKMMIPGFCVEQSDALYVTERPKQKRVMISAIPYYAWGNRGLNEMRVWLPEV